MSTSWAYRKSWRGRISRSCIIQLFRFGILAPYLSMMDEGNIIGRILVLLLTIAVIAQQSCASLTLKKDAIERIGGATRDVRKAGNVLELFKFGYGSDDFKRKDTISIPPQIPSRAVHRRIRRSFSRRSYCYTRVVKKCKIFKVGGLIKPFCVHFSEEMCHALDRWVVAEIEEE